MVLTTVRVPDGTTEPLVEITLLDLATGRETPVPGALPGDSYAVWSPDGSLLAVLAEDDGDGVVALVRVADGHRRVLRSTVGVNAPAEWSPDGAVLALTAVRGLAADRTVPFRWTRPVLAADGLGPLDDPPQLAVVRVEDDSLIWLTDDGWRWNTPRWSPDGSSIAATVTHPPSGAVGGQHLRLVGLDGSVTAPPVPGARTIVAAWTADAQLAVLLAEPRDRPSGSATQLLLIAGDSVRRVPVADGLGDVYGDHPAELADTTDSCLLPLADELIVRVGARGRMGVVRAAVGGDGSAAVLLAGDRCCTPLALAGDELIVTEQSSVSVASIRALHLLTGTERTVLSFDPHVIAPQVRRFTVPAAGGFELDGWFLSPADADGPLPTVLLVHGGPHYTYGEACSIDAHALVAAGFGVVYTNPRGSTGYGDAFAHAVHGDWAHGPSADLLAVVDHVVSAGWADGSRLGIAGNSYGGYMACWLGSTTGRFRAAVAENPATDLVAMYGTSDIGATFFTAQLGGAPHERLDVYTSQSPVLHAHRCTTPTLFVLGDRDRRCPSSQGLAMHRALCVAGTPSEVLVLPGASHEGSTYGPVPGRLAHDAALVEWMRRWLQ